MRERRADVVVVGAGPAGIAAAVRAAERGRRVLVLDDNADAGGQIWRAERKRAKPVSEAAPWFAHLASSVGVELVCGARVVDRAGDGLLVELRGNVERVCFERLILATGARERFLPFPGWTLPNVVGAGGLQAMVKGGLPIEGKRVVVAGSGPLLLAVAAYLRRRGAHIAFIAEQTHWSRLVGFAARVARSGARLRQALALGGTLAGVPFLANAWPVAAEGTSALEGVVLQTPRGCRRLACDYLACGFGLLPNLEVAMLLGCAVRDGAVAVDERQRTTIDGVFAAGEATGIGGLELSLVEGEIAGYVAAGCEREAQRLYAQRAQARGFARALAHAFELRDELRELAEAQTIVCRCEDVTYERLARHSTWRSAKLHTRCGMGACQGRICGGAAEFLFGWRNEATRPPVFPIRIAALTAPYEDMS